jgi:hypothetical protein
MKLIIPNFIELNNNLNDPRTACNRSLMATKEEKIITHISNFQKSKTNSRYNKNFL